MDTPPIVASGGRWVDTTRAAGAGVLAASGEWRRAAPACAAVPPPSTTRIATAAVVTREVEFMDPTLYGAVVETATPI
jgi:hypothetical protein